MSVMDCPCTATTASPRCRAHALQLCCRHHHRFLCLLHPHKAQQAAGALCCCAVRMPAAAGAAPLPGSQARATLSHTQCMHTTCADIIHASRILLPKPCLPHTHLDMEAGCGVAVHTPLSHHKATQTTSQLQQQQQRIQAAAATHINSEHAQWWWSAHCCAGTVLMPGCVHIRWLQDGMCCCGLGCAAAVPHCAWQGCPTNCWHCLRCLVLPLVHRSACVFIMLDVNTAYQQTVSEWMPHTFCSA